jgi:hypothetical protein
MAVKQLKIRLYSFSKKKQGSKQNMNCPSKDMATCSKHPWFPSKPMMKYLSQISHCSSQQLSLHENKDTPPSRHGKAMTGNKYSYPIKIKT